MAGQEKREKGGAETLELKVIFPPNATTPVYYVNHAEVSRGPHEIGITVGHVPTKLSDETIEEVKSTGQLRIGPVAHLVLPPNVALGLKRALEAQLEMYFRDQSLSNIESSENKK